MISLFFPSAAQVAQFLHLESGAPFSYAHLGATRSGQVLQGYDNDHNSILLGQGERSWEDAKRAIREWRMFPGGWAFILPNDADIQPGRVLCMVARVLGIWWLNSCRIVYVVDEPTRFGFAYGTLPGHAECGEELFSVERRPDGAVHYVLRSFSRPRHWLARMAYPITRAYQRRFVRHSKSAMLRAVGGSMSTLDRS
ncbi:MAG TPA: DUF1990 domain-containing protein [Saprospiraceae bacterium]|nr:DUF1990 domain-containing protein [Saprospiraceae bacterium]